MGEFFSGLIAGISAMELAVSSVLLHLMGFYNWTSVTLSGIVMIIWVMSMGDC